jgi:hypothetical protein
MKDSASDPSKQVVTNHLFHERVNHEDSGTDLGWKYKSSWRGCETRRWNAFLLTCLVKRWRICWYVFAGGTHGVTHSGRREWRYEAAQHFEGCWPWLLRFKLHRYERTNVGMQSSETGHYTQPVSTEDLQPPWQCLTELKEKGNNPWLQYSKPFHPKTLEMLRLSKHPHC